jgi:hypothetical protein
LSILDRFEPHRDYDGGLRASRPELGDHLRNDRRRRTDDGKLRHLGQTRDGPMHLDACKFAILRVDGQDGPVKFSIDKIVQDGCADAARSL